MTDKISDVFEIEHRPSTELAPVVITNTKVQDDADFARANLRSLIDTASKALQHALDVAVQSESPRAYEVLATFINASADLNTKLIDVHQRESKLSTPESAPAGEVKNVTNNVVFTGTTQELNDLIMQRLEPASSRVLNI
jgi:hypothetical protein